MEADEMRERLNKLRDLLSPEFLTEAEKVLEGVESGLPLWRALTLSKSKATHAFFSGSVTTEELKEAILAYMNGKKPKEIVNEIGIPAWIATRISTMVGRKWRPKKRYRVLCPRVLEELSLGSPLKDIVRRYALTPSEILINCLRPRGCLFGEQLEHLARAIITGEEIDLTDPCNAFTWQYGRQDIDWFRNLREVCLVRIPRKRRRLRSLLTRMSDLIAIVKLETATWPLKITLKERGVYAVALTEDCTNKVAEFLASRFLPRIVHPASFRKLRNYLKRAGFPEDLIEQTVFKITRRVRVSRSPAVT